MSRGMNTMPTARRGRTHYKQGPNDSRGFRGVCSVVAIVLVLVFPPLVLIASERSRHTRYVALSDALDSDVVELNDGRRHRRGGRGGASEELVRDALRPGALVHGTSSRIDALSSDPDMGVSVPGALALRRNAEYCQWQEIQSQRCETCTREVKARDGSRKEESYQCNCVKEYNYVKAWRSHRIVSLGFDQPGAHHNPQRDPMPTRTFVDDGASLTFRGGEGDPDHDSAADGHEYEHEGDRHDRHHQQGGVQVGLDSGMLANGVRGQRHRPVDFVRQGRAPPPSFFSRLSSFFGLPPRATRYEPMHMLRNTPDSPAAVRDNFVYVGQGGYFFSPYESGTASKLFNYFTQYMEGSLFDWQLGDLMPSCTAGDVRFYYTVQDPAVVSVLGRLRTDGDAGALTVAPRTLLGIGDRRAATVGLVHAGRSGARRMLLDEDSDSKNRAHAVRAIALLWSVPASRLVGVALARELGDSPLVPQVEGALGLFLALLGSVWLVVWGESFGAAETAVAFFAGATLGCLSYRSAARKGAGRRWNAVWCRVAKWANAPPEWRVEDSYIPAPPTGGTKLGGAGARSKLA